MMKTTNKYAVGIHADGGSDYMNTTQYQEKIDTIIKEVEEKYQTQIHDLISASEKSKFLKQKNKEIKTRIANLTCYNLY